MKSMNNYERGIGIWVEFLYIAVFNSEYLTKYEIMTLMKARIMIYGVAICVPMDWDTNLILKKS